MTPFSPPSMDIPSGFAASGARRALQAFRWSRRPRAGPAGPLTRPVGHAVLPQVGMPHVLRQCPLQACSRVPTQRELGVTTPT
jgi:hypothetical protein